jgi:hypothetical protein
MPVVFRLDGRRFHFFSSEGNPLEPVHVHVAQAGMDARTIKRLQDVNEAHRDEIERAWNEHFSA